MNFIRNKFILYMLIIASGIDFTLPWPIFNLKGKTNEQNFRHLVISEKRSRRQVVQPTWLNFGREPVIDPTVYINPQSLLEAEEIRKTIQKAVEEDTFVVTAEQESANKDLENFMSTLPPEQANATHATHSLPNWYKRMQKIWHDWTQRLFKRFRS